MKTPCRHPLALALALGALLSPLSAQQDWVSWTTVDGVAPTDLFGTAITGVGDWNLDGYDDYAVSAAGSDRVLQNAGLVSIFSGFDDSILAEIDGPFAGEQTGFSLLNLGTHNADGMPKLAVGAPFAPTLNGPFSGVVRIYAWDNTTASLNLITELLGPAPGALFGSSLAAYDMDGDADFDLAVGAMGANFQDGEVFTFRMSNAGAATPAVNAFPGAVGSMEMFGWSLSRANITAGGGPAGINGEGLLIGAPFANDLALDAGAAIYIDEFNTQTALPNPLGTTANAHLGFSVSAGQDAFGDLAGDFVAGAPDTLNGDVVFWSGSTLGVVGQLSGASAASKFGFSLTLTPDTNFDGRADLVVGSPGALNQQGAMHVYTLSPAPLQLHSAVGAAGTTGQMGWSMGILGDLNQTGKMEIGIGSPRLNGMTGRMEAFAPPAQDIGPINLALAGSFEWETDVTMGATNLSPGGGGSLYWYVGTQLSNTTSPEGYSLNIGGQLTLISVDPNPGTQALQLYHIVDLIPAGTQLFFQMVEDRNGFVRVSNTDFGVVVNPGVTLFVTGNTAGAPITLSTRWGLPNSPIYLYATTQGFTPQANNGVSNGSWLINLINARFIGQPADKSGPVGAPNEGDFTSPPINVPAGFVGITANFQAYDWDVSAPALTNIVTLTFQ